MKPSDRIKSIYLDKLGTFPDSLPALVMGFSIMQYLDEQAAENEARVGKLREDFEKINNT